MGRNKDLTPREVQVLQLASQGYLAKHTAAKMGIAFFTVRNYRRSIMDKLDAKNIVEAVAIAIHKDLI